MFSSSSARPAARRRGRLLAACTTGALAATAFALAPAGIASADSGTAPHSVQRITPQVTQHPTLTLPKSAKSGYSTAAGTAAQTPRYDYDGDGVGDMLVQDIGDHSVGVLSSAKALQGQQGYTDLGKPGVYYNSLLTPGNLTDSYAGDEVLALTQSGRLSMFSTSGLVGGSTLWSGGGWQGYNQVVAVGDITGDGFGDLLARTPSGDLYLYKSTGNVSAPFSGRVKVGHGYGIYDQLIGAGDLTGTGYETLVARDLNGDLWMYKLDGTAASPVAARVKIGHGWGVYNQLVGWGDGALYGYQIMGRSLDGTLWGYRADGSGTGTLAPRIELGNGWNTAVIANQGHEQVWGRGDLMTQTSSGNLYYYYGDNTGGLSTRQQFGQTGVWQGANVLYPMPLTDEGWDPLLQIYNGQLWDDDTNPSTYISSGWGGYNTVFGPGDLNNDGRSDLLARDGSGVLWLLTGKGDGTFYGRGKVGAGWGGYNQIVGAGDINGDGFSDIVARASNGHLYLYQGTGSGPAPFKARVDIGAGWNTYSKLAAVGDLDGDGRADIVAATSGGQLYRYSGTGKAGTSTFAKRVEIGTAGWNTYSKLF
ncbi:FG-GAP repeat domain-containing protein [Actinacidiphila rubida]|uniref:Repeat domain-containing protein n=1 Tax=Actinacidiphila rubida TaxID=310780 RepID=A0A1H8TN99_9ACTN|nr:VCBS repeat-containing protein [Actinacidiphila rubida]SEO92325.1 Repeat domain-containing protein [Actinacidiphila rubida]